MATGVLAAIHDSMERITLKSLARSQSREEHAGIITDIDVVETQRV